MVFCLCVDSILVPSEPQFCHCFSIVCLHFFSIVPQFFHCFPSIHIEAFFSLLFHSFTRHHFPLHSSLPSVFFTVFPPVLLNRPIVNTINFSFHFSDVSSVLPQCCSISPCHHFFSVLPWCYSISPSYPYVTPVRRTLTHMHLPQSLQLHRINGFARFFHGFLSVRLLHSGHTSKRPFFHCFSNVSRVLYVTWHHFTLSSVFPPL